MFLKTDRNRNKDGMNAQKKVKKEGKNEKSMMNNTINLQSFGLGTV